MLKYVKKTKTYTLKSNFLIVRTYILSEHNFCSIEENSMIFLWWKDIEKRNILNVKYL